MATLRDYGQDSDAVIGSPEATKFLLALDPYAKTDQPAGTSYKSVAEANAALKAEEDARLGKVSTEPSEKPTEAQTLQTQIDEDEAEIEKIRQQQSESISKAKAEQIASIKLQAESSRIQQREINKRALAAVRSIGLRTGSAKYAPELEVGFLSAEETAGLKRLADIDRQEQELIAKANSAAQDKEFELLKATMDDVKDTRKERMKVLADLQKKNLEAEEKEKTNIAIFNALPRDANRSIDPTKFDPAEITATLLASGIKVDAKDIVSTIDKIKEFILPGDKLGKDISVDERLFKLAKSKGWGGLTENSTIFDYWKLEKQAKSDKLGNGSGTAQDYKQFSREQVALSVIPTQMKNSENELNRLLAGIRMGLSEGRTPYEVADALMGYIIEQPSALSSGLRKYISVADLTQTQISEMARLINGQQYEKAISLVENNVYRKIQEQQKDRFVSETDVMYIVEKKNEIEKLLGEGWVNEVGAFSGSFNSWLSRKFGIGQSAQIKAKVTNLTADLVNKRAGSALTDEEWKRLVAPNIPQMNEAANTWVTKLSELRDDSLTRLNSQRTAFELPTINDKELFDRSLRIAGYSSIDFFDPVELNNQPSESNPLNLGL